MSRPAPPPILNPLPGVVWLLLGAVAGVEAVLLAAAQGWIGGPGGIAWRVLAIERLGFAAELQGWMIEARAAPPRVLLRYLAYPWVQPGPGPAALGLVLLAALGKAVAEGQGARVVLAVALAVPPLAAAAFAALAGTGAWLVGVMPVVFGLAGAFARGLGQAADGAARRRALGLVGVLLAGRLGVALALEAGPVWAADLVALGLGWALAALLAPGALPALRARLQRR